MTLKLKDKVALAEESLYARDPFQKSGRHLKLGEQGVIVKVLTELQEGGFVVKFKDKGVEKTNIYLGGMLVKLN